MNRSSHRTVIASAIALSTCLGATLFAATADEDRANARSTDAAVERPQLTRSQNTISEPTVIANAPSAMTAMGTAAVDCTCAGEYNVGDRVYALVENIQNSGLPLHARGRVVTGDFGLTNRVLVEWENWFDGHGGNGFGDCPPIVEEGDSRWWVLCAEIDSFEEIDCRCDGIYRVGDRVAAVVDNPNGASGVLAGRTGSVVSGYDSDSGLPILIEWDNWAGGHGGNGFTSCPPNESDTAENRWWTDCENVIAIETQSTAWCACDAEYSVGDEVEIVIPGFDGADLQIGDRGVVVGGRQFGSFEGGLILVEFLSWNGGHDGFGAIDCPDGAPGEGTSSWYVPCDHIKLAVCDGDLNGDGTVNGADLAILLGGFGDCN